MRTFTKLPIYKRPKLFYLKAVLLWYANLILSLKQPQLCAYLWKGGKFEID